MNEKGRDTWHAAADGPHSYLLPRQALAEAARMIEDLMMEQPAAETDSPSGTRLPASAT